MKHLIPSSHSVLKAILGLSLALGLTASFSARAAGGSGGGSSKTVTPAVIESRVTGYVTAVDYVKGRLSIGASYYGSGALVITSSTSLSMNNVSCDLSTFKVGDWAEARFVWATKEATKVNGTATVVP